MLEKKMSGGLKFTIYHGFAASLALHSAIGLPFVVHALASPPEEPPSLVIELQGVVAENQTEQKLLQETKENAQRDEANKAKPEKAFDAPTAPSEDQSEDAIENEKEASMPPPEAATNPPAAEVQAGAAGLNNVSGAEERQKAQMLRMDRDAELDRLKDYIKLLTKKVQANLVYPNEGRQAGLQGAATVSFTILHSGQIRPETLKIIASSGQPKLDASALKTVRASAPFDPPPKEMTVAIAVAFGRKP